MPARELTRRAGARGPRVRSRRAARLAFALAAGVVLASLAIVLARLGPDALWRAPAHESEPRSLLATIWFPGHALRELPHLLLLGLLWSFGWAPPVGGGAVARRLALLLAATAAVLALLFAAASGEEGAEAARQDLLQARAAPDLVAPGAHFSFHLVSDLALGGALFAAARLTGPRAQREASSPWIAPALAGTALASGAVVWGVAAATTPRAIGHAAREVETQALIALPLLLAWALRQAPAGSPVPLRARLAEAPVRAGLLVAGVAVALLALGMTRVDLGRDSSNPGRPILLNLAVHHFEHLFDAAYLLLLAELTRRSLARPEAPR